MSEQEVGPAYKTSKSSPGEPLPVASFHPLNVHRIFLNSATRCKGEIPTQNLYGTFHIQAATALLLGLLAVALMVEREGSHVLFLSRTRILSHQGLTPKTSTNPSYLLHL